MGIYRPTRCIESSVIDALKVNFATDWTNVSCEKTFKEIYSISLPSVCVRVGPTAHKFIEIGDNNTYREPQLLIDVFGSNDGNKLDLVDYIVSKLKTGFVYYDYTTAGGVVTVKTANGRIRVNSIDVTLIYADEDKNELDIHDRYRALIVCEITLGRIES